MSVHWFAVVVLALGMFVCGFRAGKDAYIARTCDLHAEDACHMFSLRRRPAAARRRGR